MTKLKILPKPPEEDPRQDFLLSVRALAQHIGTPEANDTAELLLHLCSTNTPEDKRITLIPLLPSHPFLANMAFRVVREPRRIVVYFATLPYGAWYGMLGLYAARIVRNLHFLREENIITLPRRHERAHGLIQPEANFEALYFTAHAIGNMGRSYGVNLTVLPSDVAMKSVRRLWSLQKPYGCAHTYSARLFDLFGGLEEIPHETILHVQDRFSAKKLLLAA